MPRTSLGKLAAAAAAAAYGASIWAAEPLKLLLTDIGADDAFNVGTAFTATTPSR